MSFKSFVKDYSGIIIASFVVLAFIPDPTDLVDGGLPIIELIGVISTMIVSRSKQ